MKKNETLENLACDIAEAYNTGIDNLIQVSILISIMKEVSKTIKSIDLTTDERASILLFVINEMCD